jgi:hypothetical protein
VHTGKAYYAANLVAILTGEATFLTIGDLDLAELLCPGCSTMLVA